MSIFYLYIIRHTGQGNPMKTGEEADVAVDVRWFQFDELLKAGLCTDSYHCHLPTPSWPWPPNLIDKTREKKLTLWESWLQDNKFCPPWIYGLLQLQMGEVVFICIRRFNFAFFSSIMFEFPTKQNQYLVTMSVLFLYIKSLCGKRKKS